MREEYEERLLAEQAVRREAEQAASAIVGLQVEVTRLQPRLPTSAAADLPRGFLALEMDEEVTP